MAQTNFARMTENQLTMWSRDFLQGARNMSFIDKFLGKGENSIVQKITELTKSKKGTRAVYTLVADLVGDGIVGDNTLEGKEEAMQSFEQVVNIDQLRGGLRHKGRMAEQASVVNFRMQTRDRLAYWLGDRCDQLAFLSLAGINYAYRTDGSRRPTEEGFDRAGKLSELGFAGDVEPPSTNRHVRWDATAGRLEAGDTKMVAATDRLQYRTIVRLKEFARNNWVKGVRYRGMETYVLFVTPSQMADLKLDEDFIRNSRTAGPRGDSNRLFTGDESFYLDGVSVFMHRHVPNVANAISGAAAHVGSAGYKWGANAQVNGARALFCGAQSLVMADLDMGSDAWVERDFDYAAEPGIAVAKIFGFRKPRYPAAPYYRRDMAEDFGVIACDTAQSVAIAGPA